MGCDERVAIVGLGGAFPGASNLEEFWRNVSEGVDASRDVPTGRWCIPPQLAAFDPRPGVIDRVDRTRGYFLEPFVPDLTGLDIDPNLVSQLDVRFQTGITCRESGLSSGSHGDRRPLPDWRDSRQHRPADRSHLRLGPPKSCSPAAETSLLIPGMSL